MTDFQWQNLHVVARGLDHLEWAVICNPLAVCGYVRVGPHDGDWFRNPPETLTAPGGINYDDGEWIGFDPANAWDYWKPEDWHSAAFKENLQRRHGLGLPLLGFPVVIWSKDKIVEATKALARDAWQALQRKTL